MVCIQVCKKCKKPDPNPDPDSDSHSDSYSDSHSDSDSCSCSHSDSNSDSGSGSDSCSCSDSNSDSDSGSDSDSDSGSDSCSCSYPDPYYDNEQQLVYTCAGIDCGLKICKHKIDVYTNAGYCLICSVFVCEECQMRPDGDRSFPHEECICHMCWFDILCKIKPDHIDKKFLEKYLSVVEKYNDLEIDGVYKKVKKYLCEHYNKKEQRVYFKVVQKKHHKKYKKVIQGDCFKCYLNACIYGCRSDFYRETLKERYTELVNTIE